MIYKTAPKQFDPRFEVVSCFMECEGEILLLYRNSDKSEGNRWGVPAGKVNDGEDRLAAMAREAEEESGHTVTPDQLEYLTTVFVVYPEYHFIYHIFRAKLDRKPEISIRQSEHAAYKWVSPQAAMRLPLVKDQDQCIALFYNVKSVV